MSAPPRVTVAIPTFNRPLMLKACVTRLLAQVGPEVEILVCDDASVDETASVLAAFSHPQLRVSRNPRNLGLFGNFNQCVALAAGEFVMVLSDDDLVDDDLVPSCLALLERDADAARDPVVALIAANRYLTIAAGGERVVSTVEGTVTDGFYAGDEILRHLWCGSVSFQLCGVLFRTAALRAIGGFVTGHKYAGDISTFAALFLERRVGFVATHPSAPTSCTRAASRRRSACATAWTTLPPCSTRSWPTPASGSLPERARLLAASARRYMVAEYLRNITAFHVAGGTRRDSLAAAGPALRWLFGRGSRGVPVLLRFTQDVLLPLRAREFAWTMQRVIRRLRAAPGRG